MKVLIELEEAELDSLIRFLKVARHVCKVSGQAEAYHKVSKLMEKLQKEREEG